MTLAPDEMLRVEHYTFFLEACFNERVTESIIRCLLEYFPGAARASYDIGSGIHYACDNPNVTLNIVQLLIDAAPDSVLTLTRSGKLPLHHLCGNKGIDEATSIETLNLLIEKYPEAVFHAENDGVLPIHRAAWGGRTPDFCRVLIKACPGSERRTASNGTLSLHYACLTNTLATVEYFYKLHPDAINHESTTGGYPIHYAIMGLAHRSLKDYSLCFIMLVFWSIVVPALEIIKVIYDAYPESISQEDSEGNMPLHYHCMNPKQDEDAALAILKLLIEKCPEAVRHASSKGNLPIHHAVSTSKPTEFCRVLIDAYPGSERMSYVKECHFSI
eukprot:scaffold10306_cov75-Skeletonema_marinoi.AAC.13